MKNLVILHLESLSWEIYNQQIDQLPNLKNILSESLVLNNFFSSATSSIMAVSDFLYGNNFELNNCVFFDDLQKPQGLEENLISIFEKAGHKTLGIGYPIIWRDNINNPKIWNSENTFKWVDNYEFFIGEMDKFISAPEPFVLYVWDTRSHLFYTDNEKSKGKNFIERVKLGYFCLDNTIAKILELLKQKGILENTIIVGFGDHGDEFWTHGFNGGLCHAIEPYTNLIWAPAFIYMPEEKPKKLDNLVSLIDLKKTILGLFGLKYINKFEFSGINFFEEQNRAVYSQNLFANQNCKDYDGNLNKSYSITNDNYHLMVSKNGLELYAYRLDPTNHNNLLRFFEMNSDFRLSFIERSEAHLHFKKFFAEDQVKDTENNFYILLENLRKMVSAKNSHIINEEKNLFDMDGFKKINHDHA